MGVKLGKRLVDLRKKNDLTQEEAIKKVEQIVKERKYPYSALISRSALANYEKGIRTPDNFKLKILADIYQEQYEELIYLANLDLAQEAIKEGKEDTQERTASGMDKIERDLRLLSTFKQTAGEMRTKLEDREKEESENKINKLPAQDGESYRIPELISGKERIMGLKPEEFILSYCNRNEFLFLDKYRQLTPENRAKIEERIDTLLEFQKYI